MMRKAVTPGFPKSATGIEGLDQLTRGGFPQGRATLLEGGPGAGKTVLALQTLVNGARLSGEPGIFVAFEEHSRRIIANAATFGWDLPALERKQMFFLDAQLEPDIVKSGNFDLSGMLAALSAKVERMGARRIVFDALDVVLELLDSPQAERRELHRLRDWLMAHELSALITSKIRSGPNGSERRAGRQPLGYLQFMMDCAVVLNHDLTDGVSQRNLRIVKYRGSAFAENESPFVIGEHGFEVAGERGLSGPAAKATNERVSSGIPRLDTMLGGGYYRGAGVLVTGSPGTAKTTLSGAFAEAACLRGERTLFVSFDSEPAEIVRNLASVNIRLEPQRRTGCLRLVSARSGVSSAEMQFMRIRRLAREHEARCVVIDPVSALAKQGNQATAHSVVERLTDWIKSEGITLLSTSLLDSSAPATEGTPLQISTIADTWIHLSYLVHAGERNRALTIIKSRGTAHSNQVRELILRDTGVSLEDVYTAGGEVLMGTLRWEKEQAMRAERLLLEREATRKRLELAQAEADLADRISKLERELAIKRAEDAVLEAEQSSHLDLQATSRTELKRLRGADRERSLQRKRKP